MPTRSAQEAELPLNPDDRDPNRPKTVDTPPDEPTATSTIDVLPHIPPPPIDPLRIHGWDKYTISTNALASQFAMWQDETTPKVFIYKAYGGRIKDEEEAAKLREIIRDAMELPELPSIAIPAPMRHFDKKDFPPFCSLVRGMSPVKLQEMLERVRLCTPLTLPNPH